MRVMKGFLDTVQSAYVLVADFLGSDEAHYYVALNRQAYAALLTDLTSRPDVLQVHSCRVLERHVVEDFGTMAGFLFSGDEFALDGRSDEDV